MVKKIGLGLVAVVALFLVVVATRPAEFSVSRSTQMNAPADVVYAHVADFHEWANWSPWEKLDPGMKKTYSGAPSGVGAKYEWAGNDEVGSGAMTIADARPNELIGITLEFKEPFPATNRTEFTFAPAASGTTVTWTMSGKNDFMGKAFSLFMNMDKMVGGDFEKGLGELKARSEDKAKKAAEEKAAAEKAAAEAAAAAEKAAAEAAAADAGVR
jgi:hypothetical protein